MYDFKSKLRSNLKKKLKKKLEIRFIYYYNLIIFF